MSGDNPTPHNSSFEPTIRATRAEIAELKEQINKLKKRVKVKEDALLELEYLEYKHKQRPVSKEAKQELGEGKDG